MAAPEDSLQVFATVEKAALKLRGRWKGQRGPPAANDLTEAEESGEEKALEARHRSFLLREQRQQQAMALLLEKRKVMLNSITTKMENDVELVEQVSVWPFERRCCCLRSCTVACLTDIVLRPPGNRTRRSSCPP